MNDEITLRHCPWENCDWSFYVIENSGPSQAIFGIAHDGHLRAVHDGKRPKADDLAGLFANLLRGGR